MKDSYVYHYWLSRLFFYINSSFIDRAGIHNDRFLKLVREWEGILEGIGIDDSFFEKEDKVREMRIKENR